VTDARTLTNQLWRDLDGPLELLEQLAIPGPAAVLPSVFDVTSYATAAAAVAGLALAEHAQPDHPPSVSVDTVAASAAFASEARLETVGWERPPVWDPIAGNYRTADGWIRLHTNYAHHRAAALRALGLPEGSARKAVERAVGRRAAEDLETAVVDEGGAAAALRAREEWAASEQGRATVDERPATLIDTGTKVTGWQSRGGPAPLQGLRVLDLTRVIAGPVCTRYLAAYGADVVRVDPPGFAEVPALVPDTTVGKRCVGLDLRNDDDRTTFERLLAAADVLVCGYRPAALDRLGYDPDTLRGSNPSLIIGRLDGYGWTGPWAGRRGFDSLVQMSTGIAAAGRTAGQDDGNGPPVPLPVQALDHSVGYLLAAGILRALTRRLSDGRLTEVRASLVGAANVLLGLPAGTGTPLPETTVQLIDDDTAWGPVRRVPVPTVVHGHPARWRRPAGPVGVGDAAALSWPGT
jgi:crotonobetainyl-CoA:carnitine CoA-transferase CaiB-like acyl-CoA transferase